MLKTLKKDLLKALKSIGLFSLVENSQWRSKRLLILAYHGISIDDEHQWNPELYMPADTFRGRMQIIKDRGCNVLPLGEALRLMYIDQLPEKSLAITFDDGYYDFYSKAHPILREFGFPVTLYLTTSYTQFNGPVFDVTCPYLLWKGRHQSINLRDLTGQELEFDLSEVKNRNRVEQEIVKYAREKALSISGKNLLLEQLAVLLKIDYKGLLDRRIAHQLNSDEVKIISDEGVDVELHTHYHRVPDNEQLFHREIEENRDLILAMSGTIPHHFCYPSGIYDNKFFPWLNDLDIFSATTCDPGLASKNTYNLFLPRYVDTALQSRIEFEGWLAGISAILPKRNFEHYTPRVIWDFSTNA